ncbi:hypothetical protein DV736_g3448, partial [Chaetothyriales sp. CBS 134916]
MPAPPFIYDNPSTYTFAAPTERGFNPRAATQASWVAKVPRTPKKDGPLIDFNKHPDSYAVPYQANLNVKPMHPNTRARVQRARLIQLFLRACALLGALGLLFCAIAINKTGSTIGWIIRVAPAIALVHTVYGIYHLCRAAEGRTPASTASYMVFAAIVDASLIPFLAFSAYVAYLDYNTNQYGWNTLFDKDVVTYKIIKAFFLLNATVAGILTLSLFLDGYLAAMFRKIARLPPDMNPLEPTLTSRQHKRNKSSLNITEKHMSNSTLVANRDLGIAGKRIPFIHTRADSADSVTLYGNEDARLSRVSMRKQINDANKDPYRQSQSSHASSRVTLAPTIPTLVVKPPSHSRTAGAGLDSRPERTSMPSSTPARPASWLSYVDYEGIPSELSQTANQELTKDVCPLSPVSAMSSRETSLDHQRQEQQNWYNGSDNANASRFDLNAHTTLTLPATKPSLRKRSREPLGMNPPTPRETPELVAPLAHIQDENLALHYDPYGPGYYGASPAPLVNETFTPSPREVLVPTNGNAAPRPLSSRPTSFVGSGGKTRFYSNLRNSIGSRSGDHKQMTQAEGVETHANNSDDEDEYSRPKTMQSDVSGNIQVYGSDSDSDSDEPTHQHNGQSQERRVKTTPSKNNDLAWNSPRQVSNSTAHDLHTGYAGLDAEFGKGMAARRRDVSGKVVEEGRSPYTSPGTEKLGAAGWARFKGL